MAGVVAPIAGLGGEHTAVPMALIILVLVGVSVAALFGLTRGEPRLTHDHVLDRPANCPTTVHCTIERKPLTMRAVMMYGPHDVRVEDRADPVLLEETDAIIAVSAACVCGSDLWPYRGTDPITEPTPMGHEYVGVVQQIGRSGQEHSGR